MSALWICNKCQWYQSTPPASECWQCGSLDISQEKEASPDIPDEGDLVVLMEDRDDILPDARMTWADWEKRKREFNPKRGEF